MSKKLLFLACLSIILSACGSSISNSDLSGQVALTVAAENNQMLATDAPVINFLEDAPVVEPTEVPAEVPTSTPLPPPTATTVPSPTPLPVITNFELSNYFYPTRGTVVIDVELPGFDGDLVGRLNGETLECEFSADKANILVCTGPIETYFNTTLYLLVPGTDHVALEFTIYLTSYEVATCGADVTGTWTGYISWGSGVTLLANQYNCNVSGSIRWSGDRSASVSGYVQGAVFYFEHADGSCMDSYVLPISGDFMTGSITTCHWYSGEWLNFDRVSSSPP